MILKFLFLFLSTFLLVQSSFGKALTTTVKPDLSDESETPGFKLLFYVLIEFSHIADSTLSTSKKLFQDVIADVSAQDYKNEQITSKLDEYSKIVTKIEKIQTRNSGQSSIESSFTDKFNFMGELSDLLDKSNITLIEKPTNVDKIFYESLEKNGLSNIEQQFDDKFETFAKDFNETAESVLSSVTTEQWPEKTQVQDLLKNFNTENDSEKKMELLEKLLEVLK